MATMTIRTRASRLRFFALLSMILAFPVAQAATEVKDVASEDVPSPRFSCSGRTPGYYADVITGCQKYHMCDSGGRLYTYSCPNQTLFQQRVMICDHWFMVDCSLSVNYYSSNLNIGVQGRPFIAGHEDGSRRTSNRNTQGTSQSVRETTTPYPWRRATSATPPRTVTSFTPGERIGKQPVFKKATVEKVSKSPVVRSENNVVIKNDNVQHFSPSPNIPEWTLPIEYANNPFFRGLTAAPATGASNIITDKGQREVLTSPLGKVQANVFDKIADLNNVYFTSTATTLETTTVAASSSLSTSHKSNTFSTPIQELRKPLANIQEAAYPAHTAVSPLTSGQNFVTPRGRFVQRQDELRNSFPYKFTEEELHETPPSTVQYDERPRDDFLLAEDFVSDEDADILANTVELRIPDARHMFYIADTPTREAEMLNSNNETVLTIALPTFKHHGAMKFKGSRNPKGRRDDCPQCHPAFLLPDRCQPCVLIRR